MRVVIEWVGPVFASLALFLAVKMMDWSEELMATASDIRHRCELA